MLFKWISLVINQIVNSFYQSIQEEYIQWDYTMKKFNEEILLSIERYNQMEKRFNDAKFFMQCIVYKKRRDKQQREIKHSSIMCLIKQYQNEQSTQTIRTYNDSQLIDDVIFKLERFHLNLDDNDN